MGIVSLRDDTSDGDEMDVEALVQAYVNIVAGACISLGNCPCIRLTLSFRNHEPQLNCNKKKLQAGVRHFYPNLPFLCLLLLIDAVICTPV